ncbi:MAG: hypothetical protein WCK39_04010 [Methanomassiliicoccales archaeon]
MKFDEVLQKARAVVRGALGEESAEPVKYEKGQGHDFIFQTAKGKYTVSIDDSGNVTQMNLVQGNESRPHSSDHHSKGNKHSTANVASIGEQQAGERALAAVGGGRVVEVKRKGSGYEVDISSGLGRKTKVLVNDDGTVHHQKKQRLGEMLDFDF